MKYKVAVFDLDGTLLDTIEDLRDSMNIVLAEKGYPTHDSEAYKYFVGNGMRELARKALPEDKRSEDEIDFAVASMTANYSKGWANKTAPYDGIDKLLNRLEEKGIKCAVLSNKPHALTKQVIEKLLPDWSFYPLFGERQAMGVPKKPDPAGALEIAKILNVQPNECLYLGDTGVDMKTANAAGMYAVGVLWGFRKADELLENGAKQLVANPQEILDLL